MVDLPSTSTSEPGVPLPGSAEELQRFERIQERLAPLFRRVFPYPRAPRTIVVVPSLSLDAEELAKISGVHHYEERMLCLLMLLRMPRTHLVFVTSQPIAAPILERPRLVERIWSAIPAPNTAHITCFNSTPLERSLAVRLETPLYANDPE